MAEPDKKDEEIAEILLDLDNILSDISGGDQGKAEAIAKAASTPTLPPAQPAAPPPAAKAPPAAPPPVVKMPAPAPAPAPAPVAKAPPAPAPAPKPAPAPAPVAKAPPPAQPPAEGAPVIELAPREGMIAPAPKAAPVPKPAPKPAAAEPRPPLEITLDAAPAENAAPPPTPAPKPVEPPPAPKPAAAAPPPTPAPKPEAAAPAPAAEPEANAAMAGLKDTIPEKTPKEQIRRVAFLHSKGQLEARDKFATFLDTSALTISKKPIYLRKCHAEEAGPQCDAKGVAARAKAAGAVAVLAVLEGLPESKSRELNDACEAAGLSFRPVAVSEVQKRSVAVDIMVDLMLLAGEA